MAENRYVGSYPVIGIRPVIDGRRGALKVRESLEDQTMGMAKAAAQLITENLKYSNGDPVKVIIADTTIGRVPESAACADKFKKAGVAPWKALIPIYNIVVWIKICGKNWRWYIYFLIPAINIFVFLLLVVETAKVFHRYGFWEQTFSVIFPWIYLPIVGLNNFEYYDPANEPPHKVSEARDWLDAIVFALVAAVIIRGKVLEFYNIPSSSMEKSLLTGDYLLVSKLAYGPRVTMTPLAVPLVHNVMPFSGGQAESFLRWIKLPYHRYLGLGQVERYDAVVFNYPDGDTVCTAWQSNRSYHDLVREMGRENVLNAYNTAVQEKYRFFSFGDAMFIVDKHK